MVNKEHVAKIVSAYAKRHAFAADELPGLIASVHAALAAAGMPAPLVRHPKPANPAIAVRRSVQPSSLTCLDCGHRGPMLKRHLRTAHGLSPAEYRDRWGLKPDYPMVAPNYSRRRSDLAKAIGLGTSRRSRRQ